MNYRACICLTLLVVCQSPCATAENWPGWRGPQRCAISSETKVPLRWSAESGIRWKTPLPGSGISSPVIWGDRVLVTAADGVRQSELHVICLSRETGKQLWHQRFWGTAPTRYHATKSSMASATPVTDGKHLFAFFGTGDAFCLNMQGDLIWHRSLASEYGPYENRFAATSSPCLFEDRLILQCDHYGASYLLALSTRTGENHWKIDRPETWLSWSSAQLVPVAKDRHELVVCAAHKVDAFNPRTGSFLWTVKGMRRECIPTPVFGHGKVYVVSGPKGPSMAIKPGGRGDVTETHVQWSNQRGAPFVPSAILVGDYYYLVDDNGIATCLDAHSGDRVWQKRFSGKYTASPIAAEGRIYFINEAGSTLVIRSGVDDYEELAENPLGESVFASPAISQGNVFVRTSLGMVCISGTKPTKP